MTTRVTGWGGVWFGAVLACALLVGLSAERTAAMGEQPAAPVDFARDIQPLLKERCLTCHGLAAQGGYRLDRRSGALGGVLRPNIIPGSSSTSRLIRRISDSQFGPQMPPTGPLTAADITLLARWIDEGATWPDALANEVERPPDDPAAVALAAAIRRGDRAAITAALASSPRALNGRTPGGTTPLMEAALYGDAALVTALLSAGADATARNDVGATALMWGLHDLDVVRSLLDRGADPNAASAFGRSVLQMAAAQRDPVPVVEMLLARGAKATPGTLIPAALRGDAAVIRLLLTAGARDAGQASMIALRTGCDDCLAAIAAVQPIPPLRGAVAAVLPPVGHGDARGIRDAIARGGDVRFVDAKSRTMPMLAATVETLSPDSMRLLLENGADAAATMPDGATALDFARRLGPTPVVEVLTEAGAPGRPVVDPALTFVSGNTAAAAVKRSLPLLQRTAPEFYKKSGCISCHHNTLTAMTVAAARRKGFALDEIAARREVTTLTTDVREARDQSLQGMVASGGFVTTTGYVLMALAAEGVTSEPATDAMVRLLTMAQRADGAFSSAHRPPSESSEFTATAVSLRGVQLYGHNRTWRRVGPGVVALAAQWLERTRPISTEDAVFRLFGLTWADAPTALRQSARRDVLALQRPDGGWAQLPTLASDAYATGSALVALHEAGLAATDDAYRRGVAFLLSTQVTDGSWRIRTRTHPTQSYFESGFPHGADQYISAAGTNWATQALLRAQ